MTTPGVPAEIGMRLAQALLGFFWVHSHRGDWVQANQIALEVACQEGDLAAQAQAHNDVGAGYYRQGQYDQALARLHESLAIRRDLDDRLGQALSLGHLGKIHQLLTMSVPRCLASVWDVVIPVEGSSGKARAQVSG